MKRWKDGKYGKMKKMERKIERKIERWERWKDRKIDRNTVQQSQLMEL